MKKTLFVIVIAVVLVLAFATTAMAAGRIPNRSSAYLTTIPTPGQSVAATAFAGGGLTAEQYAQVRAISAGGVKAAYIRWPEATATVANGGYGLGNMTTVHGDYTTTTIKCQVCHSVHKADKDGSFLLPGPSNGCVVCHGATSTLGIVKVSSGSSLDNRHGSSCGTLCHTESPHGVGVSEYAAGAGALFSDWSDFLTGAAIRSGASDVAEKGTKFDADLEGYDFEKVEVMVYQPALDGSDLASLTAPVTDSAIARGRAIQTGYLCSTEGCHMNGAFNGLSENAYFGNWVPYMNGSPVLTYSLTFGAGVYNSEDLRTSAIKGHELYSDFTLPVADDPNTHDVNEAVTQTAYVASGTCKACHDAVDVRTGNKAFPHSNAVWEATSTATATHTNYVKGGITETLGAYGYTKKYNDSAWFLVGASATEAKSNTNTRRIDSAWTATYSPLTVGMDGACLKCHRTGAAGSESGVGVDF